MGYFDKKYTIEKKQNFFIVRNNRYTRGNLTSSIVEFKEAVGRDFELHFPTEKSAQEYINKKLEKARAILNED